MAVARVVLNRILRPPKKDVFDAEGIVIRDPIF
jgi:hypothetical protein